MVVITGGAQGVGRYVARTFAAEGARVAIADIAPAETVVAEIEQLGAEALPIKTDVTDERQVRSLMDQVYRRWGRIDVLVNNAGLVTHFHVGAPRWPRIRDMDLGFFKRIMDTNLAGTFLCTKHVIPYMESLNDGHIINFGQGNVSEQRRADASPNIGTCVYGVSKISIRAFTRFVAEEEKEFNICVMSMGPGGATTGAQPERRAGPGIPGGGGGIVTEDSPEWARRDTGSAVMVDAIGDRYVIAAEAPMEFSGHQVVVRDGRLQIASD
ncbi:MAG: dehydrogenase [Chloroflexi bacterium]|nr:dehydrogenase [Chloroflexota bacterium]